LHVLEKLDNSFAWDRRRAIDHSTAALIARSGETRGGQELQPWHGCVTVGVQSIILQQFYHSLIKHVKVSENVTVCS
jgi:hypothetical protein